MSIMYLKKFLTIALALTICLSMSSCADRAVAPTIETSRPQIELPETNNESNDIKGYAPVKQYSDEGFVAYEIGMTSGKTIDYYDFSSLKYFKINVDSISTVYPDSPLLQIMPIIVNNKIYVFQQRYINQANIITVCTDLPNNVFIYDLNTKTSETIELPEEFYLQSMQSHAYTDGNVILIDGCRYSDTREVIDCMLEYDIVGQTMKLCERDSSELSTINIVKHNNAGWSFLSIDGQEIYRYVQEVRTGQRTKHAIYKYNDSTKEFELISDQIYPDDYSSGLVYEFYSDGEYIYYQGIDSLKQTIANFILNISDGTVKMQDEMSADSQPQFRVYGATEDRLLMTVGHHGSYGMDPAWMAVTEKENYINGDYSLDYFSWQE